MSSLERQLFFAARRCYYTNGDTYLIGLNLKTAKTLSITERKLVDRGISLGDFFNATFADEKLKELRNAVDLADRPEIEIENNFAKIKHLSAQLINDNGTLLFRTKMFGLIRSPKQSIELGTYSISIRLSTSTENTLPHMTFIVLSYQLITPNHRIIAPAVQSPTPEDPFNNITESFPSLHLEPLPEVSELLAQFAAQNHRIPSPAPMLDFPELPKVPVDLPVKVPVEKTEHVVVGVGFNIAVPQDPVEEMKALVINVDEGHLRRHWLWICDIGKQAVFQSSNHELEQGHFFEGKFVMTHGLWKCIKYLCPISPLFQGNIVRGQVHLEVSVAEYQKPDGEDGYGMIKVENIGFVVDWYRKLDKLKGDFIGRKIKIKRMKVGNEWHWVANSILK